MVLNYKISKSAESVFNYLSNMELFASVHPVIYNTEPLGCNNYKIYEKLSLLGIHTNFSYIANVMADKASGKVVVTTTVNKVLHIEIICKISGDEQQCSVTEQLSFRSILPITKLVAGIFKTQHNLLYANIEAVAD